MDNRKDTTMQFMDNQQAADRIQLNEQRLDRCSESLSLLAHALQLYMDAQQDLRSLEAYYSSPAWLEDKDAQERGEFPADLKCGVLSEDAVYDLLTDHKELCVTMAKILAALKQK